MELKISVRYLLLLVSYFRAAVSYSGTMYIYLFINPAYIARKCQREAVQSVHVCFGVSLLFWHFLWSLSLNSALNSLKLWTGKAIYQAPPVQTSTILSLNPQFRTSKLKSQFRIRRCLWVCPRATQLVPPMPPLIRFDQDYHDNDDNNDHDCDHDHVCDNYHTTYSSCSLKVLSFGCWADQADLSQLTHDEKVTRLKQALLTAGIEVIWYNVKYIFVFVFDVRGNNS